MLSTSVSLCKKDFFLREKNFLDLFWRVSIKIVFSTFMPIAILWVSSVTNHRKKKEVYVELCLIWYSSYNLKNVKNNHGGVLLLVKLQAKAWMTFLTAIWLSYGPASGHSQGDSLIYLMLFTAF